MKKLKFIIAVLVLFVLMATGVGATETKRVIHIVYDDTTGIYYGDDGEFTDKWSQLKNAVQSFAALTNPGDKLVIYPISCQGDGTVFENNSNTAEIVTKMDETLKGYSMNRSFSVVTDAWEDLKKESNSYEKWLILICDGKFEEYKDENSDNSIQEKLVSYASDGIRVVSQAISNDGAIYNLKNDENFYCYNASGAKEILQKTIDISNFIYGRKTLTEDYYEYDNRTGQLIIKDTGLPMSEMIFLVNDANAALSGTIGDTSPSGVIYIKAPVGVPEVFSNSKTRLKLASGLDRRVYTYRFSNLLQPGEYKVNLSGSDDVTILYKANVSVELRLYRNGSRIDENESVSTGKYEYRVLALNPSTKQIINSPMFDGAVYSIRTENQNNITNLDKKEGEISFLKGNTRVETVIDLGTQKFSVSEGFYVFGDVDFIVSGLGKYSVDRLEFAEPFKVTVRTESLPENVSLYCSSDKNINFRVEKTSKDNEFLVYPEHAGSKSYLFTSTGNIDIVFTVSVNESGEVLTYSKPATIVIDNVSAAARFCDWVWYYKWYIAVCAGLIIAFIAAFEVYAKKAKQKKEDNSEEINEDTQEE